MPMENECLQGVVLNTLYSCAFPVLCENLLRRSPERECEPCVQVVIAGIKGLYILINRRLFLEHGNRKGVLEDATSHYDQDGSRPANTCR